MKFALALLLFCLWIADAHTQSLNEPLLLVATPELRGPYAGTVIAVTPIGRRHAGFILNRPTQSSLSQLFPEHEPSKAVKDSVYFGGPEANNVLFALVSKDIGRPCVTFFSGTCIAGHQPLVDKIIESTPNEARYYVGFVAWEEGELASEVQRGWFVVLSADNSKLFLPDTTNLYRDLAPLEKDKRRVRGLETRLMQ